MPNNYSDSYWILSVAFVLLVFCQGCHENRADDAEAMLKTVYQDSPALAVAHESNNTLLTMRYMPPWYLAYREAGGLNAGYHSLLHEYEFSMMFVLTVQSLQANEDVLMRRLTGEDDFRQRVELLNFSLARYARMDVGDTTLFPTIATIEGNYGMAGERKLIFAFPGKCSEILAENETFEILFADPVFGTGVHRFRFQVEEILQATLLDE